MGDERGGMGEGDYSTSFLCTCYICRATIILPVEGDRAPEEEGEENSWQGRPCEVST